ncbi:MAG: 6-carboxytetrahydropterin synthase [bacterium]
MIYITYKTFFSAAHSLYNKKMGRLKNKNIYGKCAGKYPHGHNYELKVTLRGDADPITGMLVNLDTVKKIVNKNVIQKLDHQDFNRLSFIKNIVPTSENLCKIVWDILAKTKLKDYLFEIRLDETDSNSIALRNG